MCALHVHVPLPAHCEATNEKTEKLLTDKATNLKSAVLMNPYLHVTEQGQLNFNEGVCETMYDACDHCLLMIVSLIVSVIYEDHNINKLSKGIQQFLNTRYKVLDGVITEKQNLSTLAHRLARHKKRRKR